MNDQQSPSAPDPQHTTSSNPVGRLPGRSALSDQEAFSLLAESMADNNNNGLGSSGDQRIHGRNGDDADLDRRRDRTRPLARSEGWQSVAPAPEWPARNGGHHRTTDDMPPVVPFRIESTALSSAALSERRPGVFGGESTNRRRFDWSTPVLVDEHWEVVDPPDIDPIHGQITEVIDLTRMAPGVISPQHRAGETKFDPRPETVDSLEAGPAETNGTAEVEPKLIAPILSEVEEKPDADPLPPLVFLTTRGDIIPRIGETPTDRNGDTFDGEMAPWDGGEPLVGTTTSAGGVESMAESSADVDGAVDNGGATAEPGESVEPGLNRARDTQVLHAPQTSDPQVDPIPGPSPEILDMGPSHPAVVSPLPQDFESDPRIDELQRIFDQYSGPVIAVIASIAGERRAIDEALQSTFEAVWKTVDTFDPEQPRGPWMFTLARRQATEQVDVARRLEQESKPGRYPVPSHRQDEAFTVDKSWEAWEVRLAVDQLTQAEHDVLRLIHNEGLIHPEIAAQMHTTVGAVKSHAYSGSHRLVELLDHVIRPEAVDGLTVDQASALTWYLAGVADGSDLGTEERFAVKRVQAQLASATAWINPDGHARERVIAHARRTLDDPGPLTGAGVDQRGLGYNSADAGPVAAAEAAASSGRQGAVPSRLAGQPWLIIGLSAVGLIALIAAFSLRSGSTDAGSETVRRHQMQTSALDADATGVVEITTVPTGSRYEFEFGGLDPTTDEQFYAAWLQSTAGGAVVPLGTFSWRAAGDPLVLSGPTWSDAYDLLVITRSETMTRAGIDDPTVLSVSIE